MSYTLPFDPALKPVDLVDLMALSNQRFAAIDYDVRYATENNFTGKQVYPVARLFVARDAAEALMDAAAELSHTHGLGLRLFDAYRPWHVTVYFWDHFPNDHLYLADPNEGSRHNRGLAVDLTLYNLATGQEIAMPSEYDEFNEKAHLAYTGGTNEQNTARDILQQLMLKHGFTSHPYEWWHFDYKNWQDHAVLDISFAELIKAFDG